MVNSTKSKKTEVGTVKGTNASSALTFSNARIVSRRLNIENILSKSSLDTSDGSVLLCSKLQQCKQKLRH